MELHGHLIEYTPGQRFQIINTTGVQCIDNQYIYVLSHSLRYICYAASVDDVKIVQMRGGTQYSYVTCTNEG